MKMLARALVGAIACGSAAAQMHKVEDTPVNVTRAIAVYEYSGDVKKPNAARLTPVSLFIGGRFEDAGVYLSRPVPFAVAPGLRYELQKAGSREGFLDVIAARNWNAAGSSAAAATAFDDGWFGYGRWLPPTAGAAKAPAVPKCIRGRDVDVEIKPRDDKQNDPNNSNGRSGGSSGPMGGGGGLPQRRSGGGGAGGGGGQGGGGQGGGGQRPQPTVQKRSAEEEARIRDGCVDEPEFATNERVGGREAADDDRRDADRPTLKRAPVDDRREAGGVKKGEKPPSVVVTATGGPGDDPDRPVIRKRTTEDGDANGLAPDPMEYRAKASLVEAKAAPVDAKVAEVSPPQGRALGVNDTVTSESTINGADTMTGGPVMRRGKIEIPKETETTHAVSGTAAGPRGAALGAGRLAVVVSPPLDAVVAVSDAKDRTAHTFAYTFASEAERSSAMVQMERMAQAAVDGNKMVVARAGGAAPGRAAAGRARARATAKKPVVVAPVFADEVMSAFELEYGAGPAYVFSARVPGEVDRFVTVVAHTDAEGKIARSMQSVTSAATLDRVPKMRLVDAVDADGSNRGSLLMELRSATSRQFALYRLIGNKPEQIFLSGTTLL